MLAIEDGAVDDVRDVGLLDVADFPVPEEGIDGEAWHQEGEEEAELVDDPHVEPPLSKDPYELKAESLLKLRPPKLDEQEDAQIERASSAESLQTPPRKDAPALVRRPHVVTPKKLFQELEPAGHSDLNDLASARELMRQQLRQTQSSLRSISGIFGMVDKSRFSDSPDRAELARRQSLGRKQDRAAETGHMPFDRFGTSFC